MNKILLCALCALLGATLACSIFVGGPKYPDDAVPASTEAAQSFQEQLQQALQSAAQTGVVSLQITEAQLTSYLAQRLAAQSHPPISDPRVVLRDGQMKVFGKTQTGVFTANVSMTIQVGIDENGQPRIAITQTDFGPVAAPQALNDALTASLQEAFTGWFGPVATGFRLDAITIGDGVMTVTGRIK